MSFHRVNKINKTRKIHKCDCYGYMIGKGHKAEYNVGEYEGSFYSYYFCEFCYKFIEKYNIDFNEGFEPYGELENILDLCKNK